MIISILIVFNVYRMMFFILKKAWIVKCTPPQMQKVFLNFKLRKQPEKESISVKKCLFVSFGCQNLGVYTSIPVWKSHSLQRGQSPTCIVRNGFQTPPVCKAPSSPPRPLFKKICPCTMLPPPFNFSDSPSLRGRYLKFTSPLFKKGEVRTMTWKNSPTWNDIT